jgi:hypothetical protein
MSNTEKREKEYRKESGAGKQRRRCKLNCGASPASIDMQAPTPMRAIACLKERVTRRATQPHNLRMNERLCDVEDKVVC